MAEARFTKGSLLRHVVVMASTSSVGLFALFFVDAVNLFYISMLGVTELAAAIGFAGTIQFFIISVSIGLAIAGTATVSRAIGADDEARAKSLATSSLVISVLVLAVVAAFVWVWREEALRLLGARGATLEQASLFLAIALPSVPLIGIGMACGGALRAVGEAKQAMWVTLGGGGIAAVLDPIMIFALDLGLVGAALALALTRTAIAMIGLWFVVAKHNLLIRPRLGQIAGNLRPILTIAGPAMATQLSTPFGMAFLVSTVSVHGEAAVAGWAVVGRLTALAFGGIFALSAAVGPIVGQNYGAGLPDRVVATFRDALLVAVAYVAVAWLLLWLATDWIVAGFGLSAEGAEVLAAFTHLGAGAYVFTGALFAANACFNNLGRPLWSTLCNWSRDAAIIPLLALVVTGTFGPADAVYIQATAGALVGSFAAVLALRTVGRLASTAKPKAPTVGVPEVPAYASGRAAQSLAVDPTATETSDPAHPINRA
ncbi:MAG: MATE family efflux transporter [Pseudomonadota bacterium]